MPFVRRLVGEIGQALARDPPLIQILVGARQTGKSTAAEQVARAWRGPTHSASADSPVPHGPEWIESHWMTAEREAAAGGAPVLLVLDEIQKVRGWSESVKSLWDANRRARRNIRPLLLGSSALLVHRGLTESLAGRFLLHRCPHWSFPECREAFGWDLSRWLYFGGYPGAAALAGEPELWRRYVADALVETAIARDVLALEPIGKPALLRQAFGFATQHPAEIVSYTKMVATLQDAGSTVTVAHYLRLLEACFLVSALERMTGQPRLRGSTPKLVLWNNALVTAMSGLSFSEALADRAYWGRLVENAAGAHLLNGLPPPRFVTGYWRDRSDEIDFVVASGRSRLGIEIKSGRPGRLPGVAAFRRRFPTARVLVVGGGGLPLEDFFSTEPEALVGSAKP
jgi:predicted AAA+ superfamily ATPase